MNATCDSLEMTLAEQYQLYWDCRQLADNFQVGGLHEQRSADRTAEYRGASKRKRCGGDNGNELPTQDGTRAGDKVPRGKPRYDRAADHRRQDDTSSLLMSSVNAASSVQTPDLISMRRNSDASVQTQDNSTQLQNPDNSARAESSNRDVDDCSMQDSSCQISLTRTSTEDLNQAITEMTQQLVKQNSPTSLTRTKSKELSDVITQLTQQLLEDVDCHSPTETDEAGQESMPEFLLRDIEQFLSPVDDALNQAEAAASSQVLQPPVLQQCSSELAGLQNSCPLQLASKKAHELRPDARTMAADFRKNRMFDEAAQADALTGQLERGVFRESAESEKADVQQTTQVVGPFLTCAPGVLEPTAARHEPRATYVPVQIQQMQQYQMQQYQLQQMQMMQMMQVHMRQTQMMRAQLMFGHLVGEDMFVGKPVVMIAGKYRGRKAVVECRLKSKYRLKVEGVSQHLEFYPKQFAIPQAIRHKTSNNTKLNC